MSRNAPECYIILFVYLTEFGDSGHKKVPKFARVIYHWFYNAHGIQVYFHKTNGYTRVGRASFFQLEHRNRHHRRKYE